MFGFTQTYGNANGDAWMLKVDAHGDSLVSHSYNFGANEACFSATATTDGNYLMVVSNSWENTNSDIRLLKVSPPGDTLSTRLYSGIGDDIARGISTTANGTYLIAGGNNSYTTTTNNYGDAWLLRVEEP